MNEISPQTEAASIEAQRLALEQVGRELIGRKYDPVFWALALAQAEGSEERAKAAYIELRVPHLAEEYAVEAQRKVQQAEVVRQLDENMRNQMFLDDPDRALRYDAIDRKYRNAGKNFASILRVLGVRRS